MAQHFSLTKQNIVELLSDEGITEEESRRLFGAVEDIASKATLSPVFDIGDFTRTKIGDTLVLALSEEYCDEGTVKGREKAKSLGLLFERCVALSVNPREFGVSTLGNIELHIGEFFDKKTNEFSSFIIEAFYVA